MKLFLFDLDGTLLTTGGAGLRALDRAFERLRGVPRAMQGISAAGKTDPLIVREVFEKKVGRSPAPAELAAVCETYLEFLEEELRAAPGYRVMDGVPALLDELSLRGDVLVGLGTGNLEKGARLKLAPGGLNKYFAFGGFGSDSEDRPEVLRMAVRRAEERAARALAKEDVLVIGDTVLDVRAGRAIGARTVAVATGHVRRPELEAAGPDLFLESFRDGAALVRWAFDGEGGGIKGGAR